MVNILANMITSGVSADVLDVVKRRIQGTAAKLGDVKTEQAVAVITEIFKRAETLEAEYKDKFDGTFNGYWDDPNDVSEWIEWMDNGTIPNDADNADKRIAYNSEDLPLYNYVQAIKKQMKAEAARNYYEHFSIEEQLPHSISSYAGDSYREVDQGKAERDNPKLYERWKSTIARYHQLEHGHNGTTPLTYALKGVVSRPGDPLGQGMVAMRIGVS
jgi:hypothetical protein